MNKTYWMYPSWQECVCVKIAKQRCPPIKYMSTKLCPRSDLATCETGSRETGPHSSGANRSLCSWDAPEKRIKKKTWTFWIHRNGGFQQWWFPVFKDLFHIPFSKIKNHQTKNSEMLQTLETTTKKCGIYQNFKKSIKIYTSTHKTSETIKSQDIWGIWPFCAALSTAAIVLSFRNRFNTEGSPPLKDHRWNMSNCTKHLQFWWRSRKVPSKKVFLLVQQKYKKGHVKTSLWFVNDSKLLESIETTSHSTNHFNQLTTYHDGHHINMSKVGMGSCPSFFHFLGGQQKWIK